MPVLNFTNNSTRKIALNTLFSYTGRIVGSALALVTVGFITRVLGQEGFGAYTTVLAFLSVFAIFADFGLQSLMTRELSRANEGFNKIASNFFTLRLIGGLFFLLIGFGIAFLLPYSREIKIGMGIGVAGFFFLAINQLLLGIFQKHLAMHITAIAEIVNRGTQLLLVYLIYTRYMGDPIPYIENNLYLFLFAMSVASFIMFSFSFMLARRYVKVGISLDIKYWLKILHTTWPIALSIVLVLIYFKIDTIFLSLMKPQEDVGIYGVAYRVLESLIFFPAMFSGVMMPILSRDAAYDISHFKQVFKKTIGIIGFFAAPVVAGGIVLSYSIANLIGGKEFLDSGAPLQALFIAAGLIFFGNILGKAVIALDLQKKVIIIYFLGIVFNVVLNFIFIPRYTYLGAAWTTSATEFIIVLFLFWIVWSRFERQNIREIIDISNLIKVVFAAAIMASILFMLVSPITTPLSFLSLGLFIVLGAAIYFAILYLIQGINTKEIRKILTIK